jgi:TAT-translocated FGD2 family F420-dependent dehydrogenase
MVAVGFVLSHEQFAPPKLLEYGVAAERAGFDMVWASDHFHPWMDNQGHAGHAWVTLAALGQQLSIPMGTGVTCPTYRYHPAIVAQAFATLGVLYPGRVFLGVGSGEAVNEKAATGQWGDYEERADRLVEAVRLIRDLWSGEWISHHGQYYDVEIARIYDLPKEQIPIYIAAGGEESMRLAGRYGDGLVTDAKTALDSKMRAAFAEGAKAEGKNPANLSIHAESFVFVGSRDEAVAAAEKWRFIPKAWEKYVENSDPRAILSQSRKDVEIDEVLESWVISPDADAHIEAIQKLAEGGVTHVYIHSAQENQQAVVDFYGKHVLPEVQHEQSSVEAVK